MYSNDEIDEVVSNLRNCRGSGDDAVLSGLEVIKQLRGQLEDIRCKAMSAVWLYASERACPDELQTLYDDAREVFLGRDKKHIAAIETELLRVKNELRQYSQAQQSRSPITAIYSVVGLSKEGYNIRRALPIAKMHIASNGALEVEVLLP